MIKNAHAAMAAIFLLAIGTTAFAAEMTGDKAQTSRMSQCSADAKEKGLKGDARKEFMSQCLRASDSQAATKQCNADATQKGLTGDKRKDFMKACTKSKAASPVG